MYCRAERVAKFGPPWVMMYIWSNTLSEAMTCRTTTSIVVRRSIGTVMRQICCHGPAPSIDDASYRSRGMSCNPARYNTKLNPSVHHRVVSASENIATFGSPSQLGSVNPSLTAQRVSRPSTGVYIQIQISATTAEGRTYGRKNASRKNHRARRARSASSAKKNDRITRGGVVRIVNQMVCHSDDQKSRLLIASA